MDFFKKVYDFFASDKTPGSGFYMALVPMISSVGDYFLGSGNPVLMGIGAGIAAIYAGAHAIGQGIAAKNTAQAAATPTVPTVNQTPFGTPKVGPDAVPATPPAAAAPADALDDGPVDLGQLPSQTDAPPLSDAQIDAIKQIVAQQPSVSMNTQGVAGNVLPTAADLAGAPKVEPHGDAFWNAQGAQQGAPPPAAKTGA